MLLKSSKYHYNMCFLFVFPSPSYVSLTYEFSSCCGGMGLNFANIFRTFINCSRRISIFIPRFSPLGWHSQREAHFPSRITGAEFAILWALITSALFCSFYPSLRTLSFMTGKHVLVSSRKWLLRMNCSR